MTRVRNIFILSKIKVKFMSIITARVAQAPLYGTNQFFSSLALQEEQGTYITMFMHVPFVNTKKVANPNVSAIKNTI